jgi:hypothetical protein
MHSIIRWNLPGVLILLCGIALLQSCKSVNKSQHVTRQFSFLEGRWKASEDGLDVFESWSYDKNNVLSAHTVTLQDNNDTLSDERASLLSSGKGFIYRLRNLDLGSEISADYPVISYTDTSFVCENRMLDFPLRISYIRLSADRMKMIADDGSTPPLESYEFLFVRVKNK